MSLFQPELDQAGCRTPIPEVRRVIVKILRENWEGWSDDRLLDSPDDSDLFISLVQDRLRNWSLSDDLICRILVDTRKNPSLRRESGFRKGRVVRAPLPPLAKQLSAVGCGIQVEDFEDALVQVFMEDYDDHFSTEMIRYRTRAVRIYCEKVRQLIRCDQIDDAMIIRSLGNLRKSGKLADLMSD